jgi:hypothetical protein
VGGNFGNSIKNERTESELLVNWEIDWEAGVVSSQAPIHWVYYVSYSPSGDRVVAASVDGAVDIYVADAGKLLEIAQSQVTRELTCQERVQFLYEDLVCEPEETPTPSPTAAATPTP